MRSGVATVNRNSPPFPLVPFGGFNESGLGRELGPEGLANFLETRTIGIPPSLVD
jgi:acyl-CoA reductase-like NAD-dependent aldehyde dehydrogenase